MTRLALRMAACLMVPRVPLMFVTSSTEWASTTKRLLPCQVRVGRTYTACAIHRSKSGLQSLLIMLAASTYKRLSCQLHCQAVDDYLLAGCSELLVHFGHLLGWRYCRSIAAIQLILRRRLPGMCQLVCESVAVGPIVVTQQLSLLVWCRGALSGTLPHRPQWV